MSKNRYSTLVATAALLFAGPALAQSDYGTGRILEVPRATGAITLDGNDNDAAWSNAQEVDLVSHWNGGFYDNTIDGGTWGDPEVPDVDVRAKLLWDNGVFYLYVRHVDYQDLFFGEEGAPYNGEQFLIGVDLTHADDMSTDNVDYSGFPWNAPDLGATVYKISGHYGEGSTGITSNWGFADIFPVDSGWVAGHVFIDEANFTWGVEMAIYGDEIVENGMIGFNAGGASGDERMLQDTSTFGDAVYAYYGWEVCAENAPPEHPSCADPGGSVMSDAGSFATVHLVPVVANEAGPGTAEGFALVQRGANPFTGRTALGYTLPRAGQVELAAYDVLGRRVAQLDAGARPAGEHAAAFDATALPAGVYLVRLVVDGAPVATLRLLQAR